MTQENERLRGVIERVRAWLVATYRNPRETIHAQVFGSCGTPDAVLLRSDIEMLVAAPVGEETGTLTFARFSAANLRRCESPEGFNHTLSGWSTSDWMTALVGEVGEAANIVKKLNRFRDSTRGNSDSVTVAGLRDELQKELGDVFIYLDLLAQSLGFNVFDAAVAVFDAKSEKIGYPERLAALAASPAPAPEPLKDAALTAALGYLYKHGDGSADACNLWEQIHEAQGCDECTKKRAAYPPAPPLAGEAPPAALVEYLETETEIEMTSTNRLDDRLAALLDSQYRAGAKAGWNAALSEHPDEAIARLIRVEAGDLAPLKRPTGPVAPENSEPSIAPDGSCAACGAGADDTCENGQRCVSCGSRRIWSIRALQAGGHSVLAHKYNDLAECPVCATGPAAPEAMPETCPAWVMAQLEHGRIPCQLPVGHLGSHQNGTYGWWDGRRPVEPPPAPEKDKP